MKKNFKFVLALVLAAMMVVGSFAAIADDLPAPEGLTADTNITIKGLTENDEVTLYQVLKWGTLTGGNNYGWVLTDAFAGQATVQAVVDRINAGTTTRYELTEADVNAITTVINTANPRAVVTSEKVPASGVYTKETPNQADKGMYIALIKPITAGMVYNPVIVSADYNSLSGDNGTNVIGDSSSLLTTTTVGDSAAIVKKKTITVEKTGPQYDRNAGDVIDFTITTTIPAYAEVYTAPFFNITDKMSNWLVLTDDAITVTTNPAVTVDSTTKDADKHGFKIVFNSAAIKALKQASEVTVTYKAKLTTDAPYNVNEAENKVTVDYSNNPNEETGKGILKDGTNHYTFDIDASVVGDASYRTGELVKVGKDANGSDILAMKELSNTSSHSALENARFGLYTDISCADNTIYKNEIDLNGDGAIANNEKFTWDHIMSDANGLMGMDGMTGIRGLDAGTYYLKELQAPAGYIKSTKIVEIVVSAVIEDVDVTETLEGQTVTYKVPTLKSYKITVDGTESNYTVTNVGPSVTEIRKSDNSSEIVNTKGVELPSTGGIGTTIFYVGGSLMVLAAAILLITKRRMGVED